MKIDCIQHGQAVVLAVHGRMDAESAHEFEEKCRQWMQAGTTRLIADLSGLAYISSLGLRSVLSVAQELKAKGGSLVLCGVQGLVRQVFEMTRLLDLFPEFKSAEEALRQGSSTPGIAV